MFDNPNPQPFCDKCKRFYNPATPHTCFPDDMSLEAERRKLKKWLGQGAKLFKSKEN